MKLEQKSKAFLTLALFATAMLGIITFTVHNYLRFQNGISVQGTITDINSYRISGRRTWRATIRAEVNNVLVSERLPIQGGRLSTGRTHISSTPLNVGDPLEMLAVPAGSSYDLAIAHEVRSLWPELFWEVFILLFVCLAAWIVKNGKPVSKQRD